MSSDPLAISDSDPLDISDSDPLELSERSEPSERSEASKNHVKRCVEAARKPYKIERLRRVGSALARFQANELEKPLLEAANHEPIKVSSTEVVGAADEFYELKNTLEDPTTMAADASEQRAVLAAETGYFEMAMDAATTIGARNSVEKMLAHQMAAAHGLAMQFARQAQDAKTTDERIKLAKASGQATISFQRGVETLAKLRRGGRQVVTVQHVTVNEGAQAVIAANINKKKD